MLTDSEDLGTLSALGAPDPPLLGEGGEARVYALGHRQVLRLMRPGASLTQQRVRAELLAEIAAGRGAIAFATPEVERLVEIDGRVAVIERRLPGIPFSQALSEAQGAERQQLLLSYLEAASQIGDIAIKRDFFGDLGSERAIRRPSYRDYLQARLEMTRSLPGPLSHLPITDLDGIPDCSSGAFVHFDLFPGNVLVEAGRVSAVIDFGATSMIADRRLDCWSAVAYLDAELSPEANLEDRALALHWLEQRGFGAEFAAAKRWIASYWCFAFDDPKVSAWCTRVLAP
ncbi:aminoglycoside phosphotransferase family protein [Devosia sp. Root105]|uniref:phosphotransferase family protein n=1 Tax=Devosia sp. Root105 TaxID=1736423 RepID=UPI0006F8AC44|nr:aminoglycoside phosphotransferase family protein [Devosia sp. Root105]KQU98087.1 hypothetical protein ASC68_28145 [Devosia sp. Root105]